ncbi:hypothetical protein [Sphingomonas sp.]|uniref:hypothetical protein n=1 Tax=Sphingomonas sp. TaxID=28214 RepID=UPI0017E131EB|nr:hypothetical protein [Sphingomonas sp.]MBA4762193.1 hypothetical protein [Sphingomonas sp.]
MPEWSLYVALVIAFLLALIVDAQVQLSSTRKGDGLIKMWLKGGLAGGVAMVGFIAVFLVLANLVNALAG